MEISLSRPSPVACRLRRSLYIRQTLYTVHRVPYVSRRATYTGYRCSSGSCIQTAPSGTSAYCWILLVVAARFALSTVTQRLPVGLTIIHNVAGEKRRFAGFGGTLHARTVSFRLSMAPRGLVCRELCTRKLWNLESNNSLSRIF